MTAKKPNAEALRKKLSPEQFRVTQQCGTEPPFQNAYWNNKDQGIYVDVVSGEPLFSSLDKFDSGTGWPSFTQPIQGKKLIERPDPGPFGTRTELRSPKADSHLGHVFDDGPGPNGQRYCINSASLRFVAVNDLQAEGYGDYLALFGLRPEPSDADEKAAPEVDEIVLSGGCFWGVEELLQGLDGVIDTEVGYTGGEVKDPSYADVTTGRSGHAEAVLVRYQPTVISTAELLDNFFRLHDPTTLNRQGNDVGTQYRSAIFYRDARQQAEAVQAVQRAQNSGRWKQAVVTQVVPASTFYPAESYHQDYLKKHPGGYSCHYFRD